MKWLGIVAAFVTLMASAPANAQVTSHPTICRNWGNLAMGVYARYQTKYKTVFALLASQLAMKRPTLAARVGAKRTSSIC
jgi:hypothetical protein